MNIDEVLKMTEDMELISDFLTNARFVGDRVHVSIEHLADCIRNRPQSEASAEALEVFDAMIKYGEHQMECSFEELLNNMKVKEAKQTIRAALATPPVGWIKTTDKLPEKPGLKSYEYVDCLIFHRGEIKLRPWNCEHLCWDDEHYDDFYCAPTDPTHWMPLPAPPHTEERG